LAADRLAQRRYQRLCFLQCHTFILAKHVRSLYF